jgi:hypothetical protein
MLTREAAFVAFQLLLLIWNAPREKRVCHAFALARSTKLRSATVTNQPIPTQTPKPPPADTTAYSSRFACDAWAESGRPVVATHFEPRFAGFRANVHGRSNGALGAKTRRERRWRSARRSAGASGREFPQP